jgi:hypothetical protein
MNNFDDRLRSILNNLDLGWKYKVSDYATSSGQEAKFAKEGQEELSQAISQIKAEIASQMPKRRVGIHNECSICKFLVPDECSCKIALEQVKEALQLGGKKE